MIDQVIIPDLDPLVLESIFPLPGRNDPCRCGSGAKYKKCCSSTDEEAWSAVARVRPKASAMLTWLLRTVPRSNHPEYDLHG